MIPILNDSQLTLRPFIIADAPKVQEMASNYDLYRTTLNLPRPYELETALEWINSHSNNAFEFGFYTWAIVDHTQSTLVGCLSLGQNLKNKTAEVGYWIGEEFWGRGYGTRATQLAIHFAFKTLKINKLIGRYFCVNPASGKIMDKCGMKFEGIQKESIYKDQTYHDIGFYGLLRSEWLKLNQNRLSLNLEIKKVDTVYASALQYIEQRAFEEDIERYGDREDCPANESFEKLEFKLNHYDYYGIFENDKLIGGADVRYSHENMNCRLARIYIDPQYHNLGIGKKAILELEKLYPNAIKWSLDTPYQNFRNQHFYESLGYQHIKSIVIDDVLTLFEYEKLFDK